MKEKAFIHDHFVKEVFSAPQQGIEILSLVLSKIERKAFDFKRLKILPNNFIDKHSQEKRMDILFSVPFKDSKERVNILFLMEHKSYQDPGLMKQFLSYQAGIYQKTSSPVIPVFINQSPSRQWKGALEFHDSLDKFNERLRRFFGSNVLNFRLRVLNIQALDIKKLSRGLTIRPILYTLKHIWGFDKQNFVKLFEMSRNLKKSVRESLIAKATNYVCRYNPDFDEETVKKIETETLKKEDRVMESFIDKAVREGREQGMQQGMQQVALNLLKKNTDISLISDVTGMPIKEIKKLKKNGS